MSPVMLGASTTGEDDVVVTVGVLSFKFVGFGVCCAGAALVGSGAVACSPPVESVESFGAAGVSDCAAGARAGAGFSTGGCAADGV